MARKKKVGEPVNHERWMASYADFITLLFAFFTAMYAISNADSTKLQKLVASMNGAFGNAAEAASGKASPVAHDTPGKAPFGTQFQAVPDNPISLNIGRVTEEKTLRLLQDRVGKYLVKGLDEGKVRVVVSDRGLVISIADDDLFPPGGTEINPKSGAMLRDIALSLADLPNFVRIEGHTDNVPLAGGAFPSNWELSACRASRILRYFIDESKFPPERLCATGYGEYHPMASNATTQGRGANRRVEIVVLRNRLSLMEP